MPDINNFDSDQEITVDFEIDEDFDIQLGTVYQGEPMSGGMHATDLNVTTVPYTTSSL